MATDEAVFISQSVMTSGSRRMVEVTAATFQKCVFVLLNK